MNPQEQRRERFGADAFSWGAGIENTFVVVPDSRTGKVLDEYELTDHYRRWREDLDNAESLGVDCVRWGIPWFKVNPEKGKWDWSWTDQVFARFGELRVQPIVDFIHYGTPRWMEASFLDPDYPARMAEYAERVLDRYGALIPAATPCNEPYTAAEWASRVSDWPPAVPGDRGWVAVMMALARGAVACAPVLAARNVRSVQVEVAGGAVAGDASCAELAEAETERCLLYWDLLTGKVDENHALYAWLLENGADPGQIAAIGEAQAPIDILGVNYYPQWSYRRLTREPDGAVAAAEHPGTDLFKPLLRSLAERYGKPLMVTETSWRGTPEEKAAWMRRSLADISALRAEGIGIRGYIWFPVLEMIDWKYRSGSGGAQDYRLHLGFWDLERKENSAAGAYRALIRSWKNDGGRA